MLATGSRETVEKAIKIYPLPARELGVEDIYKGLDLPSENSRDPSLPYIAINMVSSLDGKTTANGTAGSIGGKSDRRVMRNLRSVFDATLRGAGTVRADKISLGVTEDLTQSRLDAGLDAQPLDLVLSRGQERLPLDTNLLNVSPGRAAVLMPSGRPPVAREDVFTIAMPVTSSGGVDLVQAVKTLKRSYDVDKLLVEGGPTLNYSFVMLDIVEELFLTMAPKLIGDTSEGSPGIIDGPGPLLSSGKTLQLLSVHTSEDELFLRYAL